MISEGTFRYERNNHMSNKYIKYWTRWRKEHPEYRNALRQRNYAQTGGPEINCNHRTRWTITEMRLIMTSNRTDRELHKIIGRSVQAIQGMRYKLRKEL